MKNDKEIYGEILLLLSAYNMEQNLLAKADIYSKSAISILPGKREIMEIRAYVLLCLTQFDECGQILDEIGENVSANAEYLKARLNMIKGDRTNAQRNLVNYLALLGRQRHSAEDATAN